MGYTHYFAYDPNAESFVRAWTQMVDDARTIATYVQEQLGVELAGSDGTGQVELTERWICLNGTATQHLDHETLLIDAQPWRTWDENAALGYRDWARTQWDRFDADGFVWWWCKTARKPYDIAVTAILLRCAQLAADAFVIGSDGNWEHEWQHGVRCGAGGEVGPSPGQTLVALFGRGATVRENPLKNTSSGPPSARAYC